MKYHILLKSEKADGTGLVAGYSWGQDGKTPSAHCCGHQKSLDARNTPGPLRSNELSSSQAWDKPGLVLLIVRCIIVKKSLNYFYPAIDEI